MTRFVNKVFQSTYPYRFIGSLLFISLFYSCVSTKSITYFQGKGAQDTTRYATLPLITPTALTIQTDDILAVIVTSLSEESNVLFNFSNIHPITTSSFPGASVGVAGQQPLGYLVDPAGNISIPLVGNVKLAGLTLEEAGNLLKEKLNKYLKEPTVNVRLLNHKFTVLGEVGRPGVYNLLDNHTTIPEVIGMAGDLTAYGRRENVMLIRTANQKREVIKIDLTSRDVLNSPYYFIQNNDVLYVEARAGKLTSTDRTIQILPLVLGISSTVVVLLSVLLR
jgi:polysaccharide export outer membrane protein